MNANAKVRMPVLICMAVMLFGCMQEPTISMQQEAKPSELSATQLRQSRIEVERLGVFADNLAYGDRRGVYIIKDHKTGKEYIGVSGIGISETGSHYVSTGKSGHQEEDER